VDLNDKILGSWFGMAVGDALGQSVKGLKPETIKQFYKQVDTYHDVRPYIGKGVKRFRMPGLYGVQTQAALAVADCLLARRKPLSEEVARQWMDMGSQGPEHYFGVFRRPEGCFYRAVQTMPDRLVLTRADHGTALGTSLTLAIPLALHQQKPTRTLGNSSMEVALLLSVHPWEVVGTVLAGYLTLRFLLEPPPDVESGIKNEATRDWLLQGVADAIGIEKAFQQAYPGLWNLENRESTAVSQTLQSMAEQWTSSDPTSLRGWISENASRYLGQKITHPTQGQVLTLLPLALVCVLTLGPEFSRTMTATLNQGREADKLGALVGAWAGAWRGFSAIPDAWKSKLVNAREIKLRGEALARRGKLKGNKGLVEMELGLTQKEAQERQRYLPKEAPKSARSSSVLEDLWLEEEEDSFTQIKEDPFRRRQYEKDKTRKKRDRRKNLPDEEAEL